MRKVNKITSFLGFFRTLPRVAGAVCDTEANERNQGCAVRLKKYSITGILVVRNRSVHKRGTRYCLRHHTPVRHRTRSERQFGRIYACFFENSHTPGYI